MHPARTHWSWLAAIAVSACLACAASWAQGVQPVPALSARVIDQTGTLDSIQQKGLEDKLAAFEKAKGTQITILMVGTTQPEDIASYANRVANAWKIGRKGIGDGVLVVVAKADHQVRIEVAKTLEGAIPDLAAKQVIDDAITPNFRKGDFASGLQAAADQIIALANGEPLPAPAQTRSSGHGGSAGFDWFNLAILAFIAVPAAAAVARRMFGNKLGALLTGGGVGTVALLITSSLLVAGIAAFVALLLGLFSGASSAIGPGRRGGLGGGPWLGGGGGWSGGSGGGGGFSSGGGGDFGGGGASGSW